MCCTLIQMCVMDKCLDYQGVHRSHLVDHKMFEGVAHLPVAQLMS